MGRSERRVAWWSFPPPPTPNPAPRTPPPPSTLLHPHTHALSRKEGGMALGALVVRLGPAFAQHLDAAMPAIEAMLEDRHEIQACQGAAGLVGDVARAVEGQLLPWAGTLVRALLNNLRAPVRGGCGGCPSPLVSASGPDGKGWRGLSPTVVGRPESRPRTTRLAPSPRPRPRPRPRPPSVHDARVQGADDVGSWRHRHGDRRWL